MARSARIYFGREKEQGKKAKSDGLQGCGLAAYFLGDIQCGCRFIGRIKIKNDSDI